MVVLDKKKLHSVHGGWDGWSFASTVVGYMLYNPLKSVFTSFYDEWLQDSFDIDRKKYKDSQSLTDNLAHLIYNIPDAAMSSLGYVVFFSK